MTGNWIGPIVFAVALLAGDAAWEAGAAKPTPGTSAPVLLYLDRNGAIVVSNKDGSAAKVMLQGSNITQPTWARRDAADQPPYQVIYNQPLCSLHKFDVNMTNGTPSAMNFADILTPGLSCAFAPDTLGNKLVFGEAYVEGVNATSELWMMNTDGTGLIPLYSAPTGFGITFATFNPNGTRIAFVENPTVASYASRIRIFDVGSNTAATILEDADYVPRFLEWSPVTATLLFQSPTPGEIYTSIFKIDVPIVPALVTPQLFIPKATTPTWSPDGNEVAFVNNTGIAIRNEAGVIKTLVKGASRPKFRN